MAEPTPSYPDRDPHFVGWLPMPRAYARFLLPVAAGLVVAAAVAAGLIARAQRSPGPGVWGDRTADLRGVVYAEPYAMIRVPPAGAGEPRTILLVEEGKRGAKERVRPHDGRPVLLRGTLLRRADLEMLELMDGPEGLQPADLPELEQARLRRTTSRPLGRVTLPGDTEFC
jgi:hypothetical protein